MPRDLKTAQQELDDARATLATLEEQVRDGADVTPQQLADQRELIAFAELRVEAAERAEQRAAAEALDGRARAVGDRVRALVADDTTVPLIDAVRAVMDAVRALVDVAAERDTAIREVAAEGARVNEELGAGRGNPWPTEQYGFRAGTNPVSVLAVGEGRAAMVPAGELLGVALAAALVGESHTRRTAAQYMTAIPAAVASSMAGVPRLADALRYGPEEWQQLSEHGRYEASEQGRRPTSEER